MSSLYFQVLTPVPVRAPQGAVWAGQAAVWLLQGLRRLGGKLWLALQAHGEHRAAQHLRILADRWQSHDPALAQALRQARLAAPTSTTQE